jgi:magnesium chelatase family protein
VYRVSPSPPTKKFRLKFRSIRHIKKEPSSPENAARLHVRIRNPHPLRLPLHCNAQMANHHIKRFCAVDTTCHSLLENAVDRLGLSAGAYNRVLKITRSIADLEGKEAIDARHLGEAIQ